MSRRTTKQRRAARHRGLVERFGRWGVLLGMDLCEFGLSAGRLHAQGWRWSLSHDWITRPMSIVCEAPAHIGRITAIDADAGTITVEAAAKIARSSNA